MGRGLDTSFLYVIERLYRRKPIPEFTRWRYERKRMVVSPCVTQKWARVEIRVPQGRGGDERISFADSEKQSAWTYRKGIPRQHCGRIYACQYERRKWLGNEYCVSILLWRIVGWKPTLPRHTSHTMHTPHRGKRGSSSIDSMWGLEKWRVHITLNLEEADLAR